MSIFPGNSINASEYNSLYSRISTILGKGFGDSGYGQTLQSQPVKQPSDPQERDADLITANQWNQLLEDLKKAYLHQNGGTFPISFYVGSNENEGNSDIVGANSSTKEIFFADNTSKEPIQDSNTQDFDKGINNLESIMTNLEINRFQVNPSETSIDPLAIDSRISPFNGAINTEFRARFLSGDERRHFFNSGGQFRISGNVTNEEDSGSDSFQRNESWNGLLLDPGTILFGYNYTNLQLNPTNGVSLSSEIGNFQLTPSYQTVFKKEAGGGIYGNSFWQLDIRAPNESTIDLKISIVDQGPEGNPDEGNPGSIPSGIREPVTAKIDIELEGRRSANQVENDYPVIQMLSSFEL
jgi:hypothetical protein